MLIVALVTGSPVLAAKIKNLAQLGTEDFGADIEYIEFIPENDFTFQDPRYHEQSLSIFERGYAIYMSKVIQNFANKYY